jgi:predicted transcriptional regulator
MAIASSVMTKSTEYLGYAPKQLSVDLAIEMFADCRSYPASYTESLIDADMTKSISKIVMAVIEIDAKEGAENETAHSENGINRQYSKGITAYVGIPQFAHVM